MVTNYAKDVGEMLEIMVLFMLIANPGADVYTENGAIFIDRKDGSPVNAYKIEEISKEPPSIDLREGNKTEEAP